MKRALQVGAAEGLGHLARALLRTPDPVLRRWVGDIPSSDRGVPLDLRTAALLALQKRLGTPPPYAQPLPRARKQTDLNARLGDGPGPPLARVRDDDIAGGHERLLARIYHPRDTREPRPLLVYFHGGGWVVGSLDSHDTLCRVLAHESDCIVVSVAYRLAPESPFPAAVEDAVAAYDEAVDRASELGSRPDAVAVGGDSAGGNLAALVCHERRDARHPPCHQLLIYPGTDCTRSHASHRTFAHGFYLEDEEMDWYLDNYIPDVEQRAHPGASPLFAPRFEGLAPAIVSTAGFDPLRDEGEAYARKLDTAGVDVVPMPVPDLVHAFANMGRLVPRAAEARREMALCFGQRVHRVVR